MSHKVRVVDGGGNISHRKLNWVRERERAGDGEFRLGVFHFHPQSQLCSRSSTETLTPCPPREVSLADRQPHPLDIRNFTIDTHHWDGRAVLKFWANQGSPGGLIVSTTAILHR